ncbi:MAG TPA: phosphoribosyltransferase [Dehalococcoidia bacterium]|nr:phosphoribosyltransferase [Dehalococcoidia bacterium]
MSVENNSRLWLADALFQLDAVQFGEFTLGRTTVGSPVYINVRRLIGHPSALWRAAHVIHEEILALQSMRNPQVHPFDLVAGVPLGGLHIATAYSLTAKVPMIYLHPSREGNEIEGVYQPNQTAIIMDDLVTGGGSILETAEKLREQGLYVRDAFVLIDRQQGARERLLRAGINMRSCLTLEVILNHLRYTGRISDDWYKRSMDYLRSTISGSE